MIKIKLQSARDNTTRKVKIALLAALLFGIPTGGAFADQNNPVIQATGPLIGMLKADLSKSTFEELLLESQLPDAEEIVSSCKNEIKAQVECSQKSIITSTYNALSNAILPWVGYVSKDPYQVCLSRKTIRVIEGLTKNKEFFETLSLSELELYRTITQRIATDVTPNAQGALILEEINLDDLMNELDPYNRNLPISKVFENYLRVRIGLEKNPNSLTDIRDVSLMDDFYFNPQFMRKLNSYCRSGSFGASTRALLTSHYQDIPEDKFWAIANACGYITWIGNRTLNLPQVRDSLLRKAKSLSESIQAGTEFNPELTAEELWVGSRDARESVHFYSNSSPRFSEVFRKVNGYFPQVKSAMDIIKQKVDHQVQTGDFMFSSQSRGSNLAGKKAPIAQLARGVITRDYGHVAMLTKGPASENNIQVQQLHTSYDGVKFDDYGIEEAYISDRYRIQLERLMSDKLRHTLESDALAQGITADELFKKRVSSFQADFLKQVKKDFEKEKPTYKVKTTAADAFDSITKRILYLGAPEDTGDIFDRVAHARSKAINPLQSGKTESLLAQLESETKRIHAEIEKFKNSEETLRQEISAEKSRSGLSSWLYGSSDASKKLQLAESKRKKMENYLHSLRARTERAILRITENDDPSSIERKDKALEEEIKQLKTQIDQIGWGNLLRAKEIDSLTKRMNRKKEERARLYGGGEICSEFAFKEYVRYVDFLQKEFAKLYHLELAPKEHLFDLGFADSFVLHGLHPGALMPYMEQLVDKKIALRLPPDPRIFSPSAVSKPTLMALPHAIGKQCVTGCL